MRTAKLWGLAAFGLLILFFWSVLIDDPARQQWSLLCSLVVRGLEFLLPALLCLFFSLGRLLADRSGKNSFFHSFSKVPPIVRKK